MEDDKKPKKRYTVLIWIFSVILFLFSTEGLDRAGVVGWVYGLFLILLLIYYDIFRIRKAKYIPLLIPFIFTLCSIPAAFIWLNFTGLDGLEGIIFFAYPIFNIIFLIIAVIKNAILYSKIN